MLFRRMKGPIRLERGGGFYSTLFGLAAFTIFVSFLCVTGVLS